MYFGFILIFSLLCSSCLSLLDNKITVNMGLKNNIGGSIIISDNTQSYLSISGECEGQPYVILKEPIRVLLPCTNNKWTHNLNLNYTVEGDNKVSVITQSGKKLFQKTIIKNTAPEYLTFTMKTRSLSNVREVTFSPIYIPENYLLYSSDELCARSNCNSLNIVVRHNEKVHFATRDLKGHNINPQMIKIDSNTLRVFFLKVDLDEKSNIYYTDFDLISETFSEQKALTSSSSSVTNLSIVQKQNEAYLFYISNEYCESNGCGSSLKLGVRKLSNQFQVPFYFDTGNDCSTSNYRVSRPENSSLIHVLTTQSDGATCVVTPTQNVNYSTFDDSSQISHYFFQVRHFGGSEFIVDNSGKGHLFMRSTWHGGCDTWALYYKNSDDNYNSNTIVDGSCRTAIGYPGETTKPKAILNSMTFP